jgi:hypothetical protein
MDALAMPKIGGKARDRLELELTKTEVRSLQKGISTFYIFNLKGALTRQVSTKADHRHFPMCQCA